MLSRSIHVCAIFGDYEYIRWRTEFNAALTGLHRLGWVIDLNRIDKSIIRTDLRVTEAQKLESLKESTKILREFINERAGNRSQ